MPRRARLLLIEGVPGLGKSTVLDCLLRTHVVGAEERRVRTLLHLTQAHTFGPLAPAADAGTLTREENVEHLERVVELLEWLADSVEGEAVTKCFALVDTLHLTHCLRPGAVAWGDVEPYDRRLAAAGCGLVLLDAEDATIRARSVEARADTPFIRDYMLRRLVAHPSELVPYFVAERDEFRRMFERSAMRKAALPAELPLDELMAAAHVFWVEGG
ncbi:MAG: hypothetical protein WKG32_16575 [Gemmatimonadaceae bacterium]